MKEKLEQIRRACIKANPEIVELKFGCRLEYDRRIEVIDDIQGTGDGDVYKVWTLNGKKFYSDQVKDGKAYHGSLVGEGEWYTILGRTIGLADVLLAIDLVTTDRNQFELNVKSNGLFMNNNECLEASWNLRADDLSLQSEELINLIAELLS